MKDEKIINIGEEEEAITCPLAICDGSGLIENTTLICDDSTGYNTITEGTGEFEKCPCNEDDETPEQEEI